MTYVVKGVLRKGRTTLLQYHPKGHHKTPTDNEEENTKEDAITKQIKKNAYNDLVLEQDDTVCFHILEELVPKELPN